MLSGNAQDCIAIAGMAVQMYRHDRSYLEATLIGLRDLIWNAIRIKVQSVRLDVGKYRSSADVLDHVYARAERHRRRDHGVARSNPQSQQREMHRGRAGTQGQGVGRIDE